VLQFICLRFRFFGGYSVLYYLRQGGYAIVVVCLSVSNFVQKTSERICIKFPGRVSNGPMNKRLNFGGDPCSDP